MAIQLKRGTAAAWTSANTVLLVGQPGVETDTRKWKVGDGTTAWNDLEYMLGGDAGGSDVRSGFAVLASGQAVVEVSWVTADTVVVALRQAPPATSGKQLYCDPADHVAGTSFTIKSEDATDTGLVFWMAMEPTDNPIIDSGMALQAGGAAYLQKDLGSPQTEVWLTFDLAFDSTALAYWVAHPYDVFAALWFASESGIEWIVDAGPIWEYFGASTPRPTVSSPAPVAATWQTIEYHYRRSDGALELYINGSLVDNHVPDDGPADFWNMRYVVIGQVYGDGDPDEAGVYYKNVKAGTTRGGTDLIAENFGGDLSAWDVTGDCAIVADPYP